MRQGKLCKDCGEVKPVEQFYRHPAMADGHLNSCKDCKKAYQRNLTPEQREERREYDLERNTRPARRAQQSEYTRRQRRKYPERMAAYNAVSRAVRSGKLKRGACEVCGEPKTDAHHEDYAKPLEVRWFCRKHHHAIHGHLVEAF